MSNAGAKYRDEHQEMPWSDIAGLRHKLAHDYCGIDYGIVWEVIANQLLPLLSKMKALAEALPSVGPIPQNLDEFLKHGMNES